MAASSPCPRGLSLEDSIKPTSSGRKRPNLEMASAACNRPMYLLNLGHHNVSPHYEGALNSLSNETLLLSGDNSCTFCACPASNGPAMPWPQPRMTTTTYCTCPPVSAADDERASSGTPTLADEEQKSRANSSHLAVPFDPISSSKFIPSYCINRPHLFLQIHPILLYQSTHFTLIIDPIFSSKFVLSY